jgi:hypothetical protein
MALGSTQPLTEMGTSNPPGGSQWAVHMAANLSQPYGPPWSVSGIALPLTFTPTEPLLRQARL